MVTCDDDFDADEDLIEQLQETLAIGLENLVDIGEEKGVANGRWLRCTVATATMCWFGSASVMLVTCTC